jgi:hypothetical protein
MLRRMLAVSAFLVWAALPAKAADPVPAGALEQCNALQGTELASCKDTRTHFWVSTHAKRWADLPRRSDKFNVAYLNEDEQAELIAKRQDLLDQHTRSRIMKA